MSDRPVIPAGHGLVWVEAIRQPFHELFFQYLKWNNRNLDNNTGPNSRYPAVISFCAFHINSKTPRTRYGMYEANTRMDVRLVSPETNVPCQVCVHTRVSPGG